MLLPLKEKYRDQKLDDLAKVAKANIIIWYQVKIAQKPEIIAKSSTTYTDELNFVGKKKSHPYNKGKLQIDIKALSKTIYNSQNRKISKMPIWKAIELNLKVSKAEFISRWGETISLKNEIEIKEEFGRGFSVYVNHDENYYTAEKIYESLCPAFSFIIDAKDGETYHLDLEVVVILDENYLRPYTCSVTESCNFKVKKSSIIRISCQ